MCMKAPPLPPGLPPFSPVSSILHLPPLPLSIAFSFSFSFSPHSITLEQLFQVLWNKVQTPHVMCFMYLCRITFSDIFFQLHLYCKCVSIIDTNDSVATRRSALLDDGEIVIIIAIPAAVMGVVVVMIIIGAFCVKQRRQRRVTKETSVM